MHKLYLSLGTNLGNKEQNLLNAIEQINKSIGKVVRQSTFISTAPIDFVSKNQFLNAAVLVETSLSPTDCLLATQQIERQMGRKQKSINGQHFDRIIDIDLLLYDDIQLSTPELTLPHPKMFERDFVMIPLQEI
ncbi:MAG: 2-amino-4-hydroxy-6-hydroxymethyldihydropteridine diphosphokinase, partial [Bacteroidaceae bacterium]|nr:2-amino-4-hydroxy-6-hydroxymethyldihydropteridine diphosphokinase [Bacteroidaceae bacterium]